MNEIISLINFNLPDRGQLGSYARCIGKQGGSVSGALAMAYPVFKDKTN